MLSICPPSILVGILFFVKSSYGEVFNEDFFISFWASFLSPPKRWPVSNAMPIIFELLNRCNYLIWLIWKIVWGQRVSAFSRESLKNERLDFGNLFYDPNFWTWILTMSATVSILIFRLTQYDEASHCLRVLVPLLELQLLQHLAIFSGQIIFASLIMCSHDPIDFWSLLIRSQWQ